MNAYVYVYVDVYVYVYVYEGKYDIGFHVLCIFHIESC